MNGHCFISYSTADALEFARKLANKLEGGTPSIPIWFDKDDLKAGMDWDIQIDDALKSCRMVLFVMTKDSTHDKSVCRQEWSRALSFKKPIIPLWVENNIDVPFRLADRQRIDFRGEFDRGMAQLRDYLEWLDSPEGVLQGYKDRLLDAERDLRRASDADKLRIEADVEDLKKQIEAQEKVAENPEAAKKQTEQNIQNGLERERKPQLPVASFQSSKFINQPPGVAQNYFQDRTLETEQAILFLKNEAQRVLTVVGRGGAGKTAMVCRLLKFVENGGLPDDFERKHGRVNVDGIVYLSEAGSRKVNFANLFEDLCKLLPAASAEKLSALYREPQTSTESKTVQLLAAFQGLKQVIILLDNFENVVDAEKGQVRDAELDEALRAILHAPHHPVKIIITTRVSARELDTFEPARQRLLPLDTGLQPEYAREAFVLMDEGNLVGIKNAGADLLNLAVTRTLGLPRALEALYAALRTDRFTTLQELLDLPILPEQVVQAYVGEAFNRLDTNAQKVMQALAVYNRPVTPAAVDYLLAPHLPAIDSAPILRRLTNMHFARRSEGKYHLHQVDQEFALNLISKGSQTDWLTTGNQSQNNLMMYFFGKLLAAKPELIENIKQGDQQTISTEFAELIKNLEPSDKKLFEEARKGILELNPDILEKAKSPDTAQDKEFMSKFQDSLKQTKVSAKWSQYALLFRAADYFRQARKPRVEWKKLEDLSAQLAEFDLRCAAGDYDTAASVLIEIDFDYLLLWGHYRLMIELHERLQEKINDRDLTRISVGNLGNALSFIGKVKESIFNFQKALAMAREIKNRHAERVWLGNLGGGYYYLGNIRGGIECFEQALVITREIDDRKGEHIQLANLGDCHYELGEIEDAIGYSQQALDVSRKLGDRSDESRYLGNLGGFYLEYGDVEKSISLCKDSIKIADKLSNAQVQNGSRWRLAISYLVQNDLINARATIEATLEYDVPMYNHNASALHGIIALRHGDASAARGAFVRAIGQADEILSKTAEYYSALDAKGLAICGLILAGRGDPSMPIETNDGKLVPPDKSTVSAGRVAPTVDDAIATFRKARKIAPHAGVVKSILRLFDELAKCDQDGALKDVRNAAEGKE